MIDSFSKGSLFFCAFCAYLLNVSVQLSICTTQGLMALEGVAKGPAALDSLLKEFSCNI